MNTKVDTFIKGLSDLMSWHGEDWASDWKFKEELTTLLNKTFAGGKDIVDLTSLALDQYWVDDEE